MLKKELYNADLLMQACRDYTGIAVVRCEDIGLSYRICFDDCRYPVSVVIDEFENYLIDLHGKYHDNL